MADITTGNDGSVKISVDFDIGEAEKSSKDLKGVLEKFSNQLSKSLDKLAKTLDKVQNSLDETAKAQSQMAKSAEESAKSNAENADTLKTMLTILKSVNASMGDFSKMQRQASQETKNNVSSMSKEYENLTETVKGLQSENEKLKQGLSSKTKQPTTNIDLTKDVDKNVNSINRQNKELKETENVLSRVEDTKAFQKLEKQIDETYQKSEKIASNITALQQKLAKLENAKPTWSILKDTTEDILNIFPFSVQKEITETLSYVIKSGAEIGTELAQKSLSKLFNYLTTNATATLDKLDKEYENIFSERRSFLAGILSSSDLKSIDDFDKKLDKLDDSVKRVKEDLTFADNEATIEKLEKKLQSLNNAIEKTIDKKFNLLGETLSDKELKTYDNLSKKLGKVGDLYNSQLEKVDKVSGALNKIDKITFDNVKQNFLGFINNIDKQTSEALETIYLFFKQIGTSVPLEEATKAFESNTRKLIDLIDKQEKLRKEFKPQETPEPQQTPQPQKEVSSKKNVEAQKEVVNEQKKIYIQQEEINKSAGQYSSAVLRATENLKKQQIVVENIKREIESFVNTITPSEIKMVDVDIADTEAKINKIKKLIKEGPSKETVENIDLRNSLMLYFETLHEELRKTETYYESLKQKRQELASTAYESKLETASSTPRYQQLIQQLELATIREQRYQAALDETIAKQEKRNVSNEKTSKSTNKMAKSSTEMEHILKRISKYMGYSADEADSFAKKILLAIGAIEKSVTPISSVNNSLLNLGKRILNTAKSALLFSVLYRAFNQLSSIVGTVAMQNQTFANSLAQIKANLWTAFAPIWNAALPALNALMSALADITGYLAAFIAMLFGKSVKVTQKQGEALQQQANAADVAADSLDDVAGSAGDVADGMSDAAEATAEANKELAAYDKLNVINIEKPDTGTGDTGGGGGGSGGGGGGGGVGNLVEAEPVIEELNDLDVGIYDKIKKRLEDILDVVISIGAAFAAWKIANILNNLFDLKLKLKQLVGITMMVGGFTLSFTGWENVGKGTADFADALKIIIGSALGIAGSVLTFSATPLGWTFGLAVGIALTLVAAIAGIELGQAEKLKEVVQEAFYQYKEGSVSISVLTDAYSDLINTVISGQQPIIDMGDEIEQLKNENLETSKSISSIAGAIELGLYDASDKASEITSLFNKMLSNLRVILDDTYDVIVMSLSGSLGTVVENAGIDVSTFSALVAKARALTDENYDEIQQQADELYQAWQNGTITADEYTQGINKLTAQAQALTDVSMESVVNEIGALKTSVDWGDETERNNALTRISELTEEAKEKIGESKDSIIESLSLMKKTLTDSLADPDEIAQVDEIIQAVSKNFSKESFAPISNEILGTFDAMQSDVVSRIGEVVQSSYEEWERRGGIISGTSANNVIREGVQNYIQQYVDPMEETLQGALDEFGIDGSVWMEDAIWNIVAPYTSYRVTDDKESFISSLYDSINSEISERTTPTSQTAEQSGQEIGDSLYGGLGESGNEKLTPAITGLSNQLINGLFDIQTNTQPTATSTGGAISSSLLSSLLTTDMATVFGEGSPIYTTGVSSLGTLKQTLTSNATTVGKDTMSSLSSGVDNNSSLPETSITTVGKAMKDSLISTLGISSGTSTETYNIATNAIAGLTNGIDVNAANPKNSIKAVGDSLVSTTKSIFGIQGGKSTVYDTFGTSLGNALSLGIKNTSSKARNSMISMLTGIQATTNNMAGRISDSFRSMFNNILGYASTFANRVVSSVTSALSKISVATSSAGVTSSGRVTYSIPSSVYVPKLAKGAVLPANQPFLAMVGDQKRGTNVEAPLDTIKQGLREVLSEIKVGGTGNVNVYLQGDAREIFRVVKVENDKYKKQTGGSGI